MATCAHLNQIIAKSEGIKVEVRKFTVSELIEASK